MSLNGSYHFVYVGTGFNIIGFHDTRPLRQDVVEVGAIDPRPQTAEASASTGGGYVEAGLTYRFAIDLSKRPDREGMGLGLQPAVAYGFQGVGSLDRAIANCVDCESQTVADYHGGQYARFQLGLQLAACTPSFCGFLGLTPSYQYFFLEDVPGLLGMLDIALHIGFGVPNFR